MRPMTICTAAGLLLAAFSSSASASGDAAWREFDTRVIRACVAASGIQNARASTIIGFDDRAGMVAMLVSDRLRGSSRSRLCLYDKRARNAHVDDAEMWSAPPWVAGPPRR